ncbi:Liprin-beta-1 [Araneus ventricosus]|uniref:Liprin-beta-1 n=1 Tax=Araneus ventricosus TaxID=182803 RepID=A0A4Y2TQM1_ARAVE|nr:Liprin-beta-1 [Araneus ventricosus]
MEQSSRKQSSPLPVVSPKEKSKGLRKIFGKVKRTGSENLNSSAAELKRGGIRATAGPRLGWSEDLKVKRGSFRVSEPFAKWDSSLICDWLASIGLSMYVPECKKWVKNGDQMLKASTSDFEKELNIKNPLHRKKLLLAINGAKEQTGDAVEPAGKIDHQWVVRWLDDIGLPQYKDAFYDARVDGRMLHQLTLEDLSHLKVTNLLHHISIKTGIQVLRENNFDPHCLQRRSLPDEIGYQIWSIRLLPIQEDDTITQHSRAFSAAVFTSLFDENTFPDKCLESRLGARSGLYDFYPYRKMTLSLNIPGRLRRMASRWPSDYFLFPKLKKHVPERQFSSNSDMKTAAENAVGC